MDSFKDQFFVEGCIALRGFLHPNFVAEVKALADELFINKAHRNDFLMPQTNFTPRHLYVVGGKVMDEQSHIMSLYKETAKADWFKEIAGTDIELCSNPTEHVVMSRLIKTEDTHGWHEDDYAYALIMCIESPGLKRGGHVEYIDKRGEFHRMRLEVGDAYVMRTDKVRHRVAPLGEITYAPRTILNFTYGDGQVVHPNGSADLFCTDMQPLPPMERPPERVLARVLGL